MVRTDLKIVAGFWGLLAAAMLGGPAAVPATAQDATVQKAAARIEPVVLEDGRYTQAWFLNSFLILREDIADAAKQGKRLAIIWDQRGCPYCMEMQRVNFGDPVVNSYVRERFTIIQLDLFGSREVTDFDGAVMTEKEMARKYGISFTPTIQFFPETPEQLVGKVGRASEVARMPGYFKPGHFEAMFEYVHAKAYEQLPFARFLQARSDKKS